MNTPTAKELASRFFPPRLDELPPEVLHALREHSKRMFGNQDRLEVAVAITRVELGRVNATDLHNEIKVATNRIRSQLLVMVELELLRPAGVENGKRIFERCNKNDPFWKFAVHEFETVLKETRELPGASRPAAARSRSKIS